jgi:hypothetical protein
MTRGGAAASVDESALRAEAQALQQQLGALVRHLRAALEERAG